MAWGLAEFDAEQRGYKEGVSDGISQGEHQAKIETAKNMLQKNISVEVISECTGLSLDEIEIFSK
ncbi:MAG: hypothetical protein IIX47_03555 [Spirochaetaceae bacterium]|nr:hypothetical protein [Spirochaetaceae bacterium]